eukprot:6492397-Amphidinium_carterae.2
MTSSGRRRYCASGWLARIRRDSSLSVAQWMLEPERWSVQGGYEASHGHLETVLLDDDIPLLAPKCRRIMAQPTALEGPLVCMTVDTDDEYELLDDDLFGDMLSAAIVKDEPPNEVGVGDSTGVSAIAADAFANSDNLIPGEVEDNDDELNDWLVHARCLERLMSGEDTDSEWMIVDLHLGPYILPLQAQYSTSMAKGHYTPKKGRARLLRRPAERKASWVMKVKGKPASYVRRLAASMSSRHAREMDRVTPTLTWSKLQGMWTRSVWTMLRDMGLVDDGRGQHWSKCIMCGSTLAGNKCLVRVYDALPPPEERHKEEHLCGQCQCG